MFSNSFNVHLLGTDSFEPSDGGLKGMNIFITSTFGNGDPPTMAQKLTGSPISTKTLVASFKVISFNGNFQNISVTLCPPQKEKNYKHSGLLKKCLPYPGTPFLDAFAEWLEDQVQRNEEANRHYFRRNSTKSLSSQLRSLPILPVVEEERAMRTLTILSMFFCRRLIFRIFFQRRF